MIWTDSDRRLSMIYVSNGKFYASAAFTAYVGAKIGDNMIGVNPRTFYINYNCDGTGQGTGSAR